MGCHRNRPLPSSGSIMTRMPSKRPGRSATPPISRYPGGVADPGCQTRCHAAWANGRPGRVMGSGRDEGWGWLSFHETGCRMSEVDLWAAFERVSHVDRTRLTQADKRLLALGGLRAEVNNGGFDQYFFNSAGDLVADAVEAAEAGGGPQPSAPVLRGAGPPDGPEPADPPARPNAPSQPQPQGVAGNHGDYYPPPGSAHP